MVDFLPTARGRHLHTIPVDSGLSVNAAWAEICQYGERKTYSGGESWTNVWCDGLVCLSIKHATQPCPPSATISP